MFLTLVGLALAGAAEGSNNRGSSKRGGGVEGGSTTRKKAKRALQKALSIDPDAARPLLALVDLHCAEHEYVEAADLVRSSLEGTASSSFREYSAGYGASGGGGGGGKTKITEMGSDISPNVIFSSPNLRTFLLLTVITQKLYLVTIKHYLKIRRMSKLRMV